MKGRDTHPHTYEPSKASRSDKGWITRCTSEYDQVVCILLSMQYIPEEVRGTIHLEPDDHPPLARPFYLKHFNHRSIPTLDTPHYILVYLQSIVSGLLKEDFIRNCADVGLAIVGRKV